MKIAIFGITGYTGGNIAREALTRGHTLIGSARRTIDAGLPDEVTLIGADIHDPDAVLSVVGDSDAIIVAVTAHGEKNLNLALPGLLDAARTAGARLGIVGGAASLKRSEDGPRIFDDGFPEEARDEARAQLDVLDTLLSSETDQEWFYLSPAERYGSWEKDERRGTYRTGGNVVVTDAEGVSRISGEDLALAVIDELENPQHRNRRFTVAY